MAKVKITKTPTSNPSIKPNFNEQDYQIFGSNPLEFKNSANKPLKNNDEIGKTYPTEDEGNGNVEAEQGELIAKLNDNLKLFKIPGKSHKQGGTSIVMEEGDFIFSKALKIKGEIVKAEFGLSADKEYSFADIANKYIKMNDYQKLSESEQPLEKQTGLSMVEKYKDKLAKLAFLQESQKGLPNGIPAISAPLLEKISNIPTDAIPKESMMRRGGELLKYDDGGVFKSYKDKKKNKTYDVPDKFKNFTKEQADKEFYTPEVLKFMAARDKEEGIDWDKGKAQDYTWGVRHQEAYDKFFKDTAPVVDTEKSPVVETSADKPVEGFTKGPEPDFSAPTTQGGYKDLGYSSPEKLGLALAMKTIPSYAPTRYQNYGLEQALGAMTNVMPYNYQSVINEATRGGYNASGANNAFGRTPQAMVNNTAIAGQLAETTSKIKGDEYNQNAQLYNTNQSALAQLMSSIGQDKEQQAQIYGDKIVQGKENLWANRRMRDKEFLAQYSNAQNNRSLRNAYSYLGQSTNPNFPIVNADNAVAFNAMQNPFDIINGYGRGTGKSPDIATDYKNWSQQLKGINIPEEKKFEMYMKFKTKNP